MTSLLSLLLAAACTPGGKPAADSGPPAASSGAPDDSGGGGGTTEGGGGADSGGGDSGGDSGGSGDSGDSGSGGGSGGDSGGDSGLSSEQVFDAMILPGELLDGDRSCYRPGAACASLRADPSCVVQGELSGAVSEYPSGAPVAAAVDLYLSDRLGGVPDASLSADRDGVLSGASAWTCTAMSWRVTGGDGAITQGAHYALDALDALSLTAVSGAARAALVDASGVAQDPARGMVLGVIRDCAGQPLAGAQVIASQGVDYAAGQSSLYFADGVPDPAARSSAGDGTWLLLNVPPGTSWIEAYGGLEGVEEPLLIAYSDVEVTAGATSLVVLQLGYCGALIPEGCLDPCN